MMIKKHSCIWVFIGLLCFLPHPVSAQNLENIGKQKPLDLSGSLSLRLNSFTTTSANSTRDPFFWTVSGNPTLSVYGITFPFSVVFSDKQRDFRQPFNMFGVSPYYKKIKLHAGYRNVYFSDYTLSDHIFLGGGIEAEPSIFRLGFVYGRFMKATEPVTDTLYGQYTAPSFARKGFAAKFGLGTYNNFLDLILLNVRDDTTSASSNPEKIGAQGAENLVLGVKTHQKIGKLFSLDADFGLSAYTTDMSMQVVDIAEYQALGSISKLFTPRQSSEIRLAGKASFGMRIKKFSLKLNYRRVEPDYQSMGAYYLNTDIESLTLAPSWQMFKSRLRITGSIGIQRNNLFSDKINNSMRRANSLSASFTPNSKWGVNVNYSNYNMSQTRNYTFIRDTLMLEQFSNNINSNLFFNFGTKTHRQNLTLGVGYMDLADNSLNDSISNSTTSLNPMVSYRFTNTDSKLSFNLNANASSFDTDINETLRLGFTTGISKALVRDQLKLGANASFFSTRLNGENFSNTFSIGTNIGYQPHKGHNFNLGVSLVNRSFADSARPGSMDLIGYFGYTFNF